MKLFWSHTHLQAEAEKEEMPVLESSREVREGRRENREEHGLVNELQFNVHPDTDNLVKSFFISLIWNFEE